jgi:hypothetical protein
MMRALMVLVLLLLAVLAAGCNCGCGGAASCKESGVFVDMKNVTDDQISSFTASGDCGPAPSPLCQPAESCDGGQAWQVHLPASGTGTCSVAVILLDGGMLNGAVHATETTGSCCAGTYGDVAMVINGS